MLITITNQKGGVGKTMLAVHAAVYAAERGANVLVLDADNQALCAEWIKEAAPEIYCLASPDPATLREVVEAAAPHVDAIFADAPPGLGEGTLTLLELSDCVLVPLRPSYADLRATVQTIEAIKELGRSVGREVPVWVAMNMYQSTDNHTKMVEKTLRQLGVRVAKAHVGMRTAFRNSNRDGVVVWRAGKSADPKAVAEMKQLLNEVLPHELFDHDRRDRHDDQKPGSGGGAKRPDRGAHGKSIADQLAA